MSESSGREGLNISSTSWRDNGNTRTCAVNISEMELSHGNIIITQRNHFVQTIFSKCYSIKQENKIKDEGIHVPELKVVYTSFHSSCMCLYKRKKVVHDDCAQRRLSWAINEIYITSTSLNV